MVGTCLEGPERAPRKGVRGPGGQSLDGGPRGRWGPAGERGRALGWEGKGPALGGERGAPTVEPLLPGAVPRGVVSALSDAPVPAAVLGGSSTCVGGCGRGGALAKFSGFHAEGPLGG